MERKTGEITEADIDEFVSLCESKNYHKQTVVAIGCLVSTYEAEDIFGSEIKALEFATEVVNESATEEDAFTIISRKITGD